jgi:hypothetical protein
MSMGLIVRSENRPWPPPIPTPPPFAGPTIRQRQRRPPASAQLLGLGSASTRPTASCACSIPRT